MTAGRVPRILVVEDDAVNRMVVARMLKRLGCDVGQAVDGSDAIGQCQSSAWDLVFMDLEMPGIGGLAATQRIRRDPKAGGRALPIIALTGAAEADEGTHCISAGMDGFLTKPVRLADLQRELDRWLVEKRTTTSESAA